MLSRVASVLSCVPCAFLSAFDGQASLEENLRRDGELLDVLLANGFSPVRSRGEWDGLPELCWAVPGMSLDEAVGIGADFGQEAVAWGDGASGPSVFKVSL